MLFVIVVGAFSFISEWAYMLLCCEAVVNFLFWVDFRGAYGWLGFKGFLSCLNLLRFAEIWGVFAIRFWFGVFG